MRKIFLALLIFMAVFVFIFTATLVYYYSPVVDRLVNFCDKYPNSLEDCKE